MGEFPFPFGPFPWWYVVGFFLVLIVGGIVLSLRDKLNGSQSANDYLMEQVTKLTNETIGISQKLEATQRDLESLVSLHSDLIKVGLSNAFDIAVVEHGWEDQPPKPFMKGNEKVVYAERIFAFGCKRRTNGEILDIEDAQMSADATRRIRILPDKKVGFSLSKDTEDCLSDKEAFIVKFRE